MASVGEGEALEENKGPTVGAYLHRLDLAGCRGDEKEEEGGCGCGGGGHGGGRGCRRFGRGGDGVVWIGSVGFIFVFFIYSSRFGPGWVKSGYFRR